MEARPPPPLEPLGLPGPGSLSLLPCCLEQAFSYEGSKTSSIPQGGDGGSEQSRDLPWVTRMQNETQSHRVRHGAQEKSQGSDALPALQLPLR